MRVSIIRVDGALGGRHVKHPERNGTDDHKEKQHEDQSHTEFAFSRLMAARRPHQQKREFRFTVHSVLSKGHYFSHAIRLFRRPFPTKVTTGRTPVFKSYPVVPLPRRLMVRRIDLTVASVCCPAKVVLSSGRATGEPFWS